MNVASLPDTGRQGVTQASNSSIPVPRDRGSHRRRNGDDYARCRPLFEQLAGLPAGDPTRDRLRDRLILEYLPLAEHIARRFKGRGQPYDDLVQVGRLGLMNAVDRFEPARSTDFLSFAVPTIMGEVRRFFRDTGWAVHVPRRMQELQGRITAEITHLAQVMGRAPTPTELGESLRIDVETVREGLLAANCYETSSLDRPVRDGDGSATLSDVVGDLDSRIELVEDYYSVSPLLKQLPNDERTILKMRFFDGLTQSQIASRIGVSQMQVSRLLTRILEKLREKLVE